MRPGCCFRCCASLREDGVAICFVSHKLEEVFEICDTVTVLRDGRNACDSQPLEGPRPQGRGPDDDRPCRAHRQARATPQDATAPYLELKNYASSAGHKDISLAVRPGEILGLYGLVGAGRSELAKGILGDEQADRRRSARRRDAWSRSVPRPTPCTAMASAMSARTASRKASSSCIRFSAMPASRSGASWRPRSAFCATGRSIDHTAPVLRKLEVKTPSVAPDHRQPVGRQPAEGVGGEMDRGRREAADHRRAFGRHRHQDQGLSARPDPRTGRTGHRDPADHLRHAGDGRRGRPHSWSWPTSASRAKSRTTATTSACRPRSWASSMTASARPDRRRLPWRGSRASRP